MEDGDCRDDEDDDDDDGAGEGDDEYLPVGEDRVGLFHVIPQPHSDLLSEFLSSLTHCLSLQSGRVQTGPRTLSDINLSLSFGLYLRVLHDCER